MGIGEGDQCPRLTYNGTLQRAHQTSTRPELAFSYLRCPLCGWSNYEEAADNRWRGR